MRKYLSGVSQGMVASLVLAILAPIAKKYLPGTVLNVSLGTVVAVLLWLSVLAAIIVSFMKLQRLRLQTVRLLDARCVDLIASCEAIKSTYPNYQGSLAAPTYLPNGSEHESARAAIHKFNGRLRDFSDDLQLVVRLRKMRIRTPNPKGSASDLKEALGDVHRQFEMWLF
jgi:hypothetical protein